MPIVVMVLSTLALWGIYWFVRMGGIDHLREQSARRKDEAKRAQAREAEHTAPLRAIDDPRDAATILMLLIARGRDPTAQQIAAIEETMRAVFGFDQELRERLTQARFIAGRAQSFEQAAGIFSDLFKKQLTPEERGELAGMVEAPPRSRPGSSTSSSGELGSRRCDQTCRVGKANGSAQTRGPITRSACPPYRAIINRMAGTARCALTHPANLISPRFSRRHRNSRPAADAADRRGQAGRTNHDPLDSPLAAPLDNPFDSPLAAERPAPCRCRIQTRRDSLSTDSACFVADTPRCGSRRESCRRRAAIRRACRPPAVPRFRDIPHLRRPVRRRSPARVRG
jgi:hypothetical protein